MNKKEIREKIEEISQLRDEQIIKSGHYIKVAMIVGDDDMITPQIEVKKCSPMMMAKAIMTLEGIAETLREKYPMASMATEFLGADKEVHSLSGDDE